MTRKVLFSFLGLIVTTASLTSFASQSHLSLSSFLKQVQEANLSVQAAKSRAKAAEHRIRPLSTWDDPFIAAGIDEIPFGGGEGSVTRYQLSQSIPFPGKLSARGDAATSRAEASRADAETTERMLTVVATQAFYRTYFNHRQIALNDEATRYLRQAIESSKARYKAGGESHHEWLLGKVELGVLEAERLRLARDQKSLHALMNELRNLPVTTEFDIAAPVFSKHSDEPKPNLKSQPEMRSAETIKEAAEAEEKVAKLSYLPDFVVQGMMMKPRMSESGNMGPGNWGVMVGINLPVFFWRKQSEQVAAAQAEQIAADAERRSLENRLQTELVDAQEQLKSAKDVVALYEKDVIPNTEMAAKNARSGYAAKRLPLTQLIDTLRAERTQRLELLAAQIDVELAKARIENLLSSPPVMRLAPSRPTLFGGMGGGQAGAMSDGMSSSSSTVNMGSGMSGSTRKESKSGSQGASSTSGGGMGNM